MFLVSLFAPLLKITLIASSITKADDKIVTTAPVDNLVIESNADLTHNILDVFTVFLRVAFVVIYRYLMFDYQYLAFNEDYHHSSYFCRFIID